VVAGVTAVRSRGIDCYYVPLKEGYRGWFVGLAPMAHLSGLKLDCAYEYMNWYNSGWQGGFIAKQGYYSAVPATAKKFLTPEEWDYWYDGKPAAVDIKDPYGTLMEKKGTTATAAHLGPHWQHRLLEHRDGRGPLPDAALERVRFVLIGHG
jgi:putative spermidine/putrescine transport system substrate-binding protein